MGTPSRILSLALCGAILSQGNNALAQEYCPRDVTKPYLRDCQPVARQYEQLPVAKRPLPGEIFPYAYAVPQPYVVAQPYAQPVPAPVVYAQPVPAPVVYPQPVAYGPTPDAVFGFFLGAALMAGAGRRGPVPMHFMHRR